MRKKTVWAKLLGVERTVIERVELDEAEGVVVARVRPRRAERSRCGKCGRRCRRYDQGEGWRRWRALDLGATPAYLEAAAPRVECPEHGVIVAAVPWARHEARHTRAFDDQAAWLATHCAKSAVGELLRVAWRTVGSIVTRVVADARARSDPFEGLARIGVDEISYRKGQRYLIVVVDHDSGRLVWAAAGRDRKTLRGFFEALGKERCAAITLVSADAAAWIADVVAERCPNAELCTDPFHVVSWATEALDEVRRETWNEARRRGQKAVAHELKGARFALWKNPEDLTRRQQAKLSSIERTNARLYRAYLLKEQLRQVFHLPTDAALALLEAWLRWARRCRIPSFVALARSVAAHRDGIKAALVHRLSNALVESMNTKIRLITRVAFGFHSPDALIALAMLSLGGYCPTLPGRSS
ncbi:MAG: ISL3 family transposase [Actinobacteria bacterium]|nr:ISL3 family transposase [Actinomycetota bacterium]